MSESTPHFAPFVVLFFMGTALLVAVSVLTLLYGAVRRSPVPATIGLVAVTLIGGGYLFLLCVTSLASSERNLPPGGWKYFCEIDCHLAYSVVDARSSSVIGPEMQQVSAHGRYIIVRVKTWFDERTISPHRGNGPLTPNRRRISLVDDAGNAYAQSAEAERALAHLGENSTPLTQALRPGESYRTTLAFDVPREAHGLRLLITEDDPETRLVIGHENSLLHKKIFLDLDSSSTTDLTPRP